MHTLIRYAGHLTLLLAATQTHAIDTVVGPGNCDEAGFASALGTVTGSGGGLITFDCGSAPTTITFTSSKQIASTISIDGDGRIVFDGGGTSPFFQVFANANLTLKRLTVQHGVFAASHALENLGVLTLDSVNVIDNNSTSSAIANYATLTMRSSTAARNSASGAGSHAGGALFNDGDATIVRSNFIDNSVDAGAGGNGGAIAVAGGALSTSASTFASNSALDGGAIHVGPGSGAVRIANTVFVGNSAGYGAAIESLGADVQITGGTFQGNNAQFGDGGAVWSLAGQFVVNFSQFTGNTAATTGGAISCYDGVMNLINSTFASNEAGSNGGAIFSSCAFSTLNVTLNGNIAAGGGGAIYQEGVVDAVVTFATIDANSALFGGGIFNDSSNAATLYIGNSLVNANPGGNCAGVLGSNGYNLSNDSGCGAAFTGPGDVLNAALPMLALGSYGGPTSTQPPLAGNPAIDHVPVASCGFSSDQRGASRPAGAGCDSGAVEIGGIIDQLFADGFEL